MDNKEIYRKLGISTLSAMQKATASAFERTNHDIVVLSPTGTGKTLAYLLPLVGAVNPAVDDVQAIVIVPGRELALQSAKVLQQMGCGVRGYAAFGGRMAMDEHRELRNLRPHIVFATPGRLNDHLDKGNISPLKVRTVVIDEFDKCLDMGFSGEMMSVMGKLKFANRHILLSATNADSIPRFVNMQNVELVNYLEDSADVCQRIELQVLHSPINDKLDTLYAYLCTTSADSTIVFVNHRESVERIACYLADKGFVVSAFHGGLDQKQREAALYKFSNGSANVMVCTDLASRGLDIDNIAHVVHYHLPETPEAYIHRVGRTARWQAEGTSLFILGPKESLPQYVGPSEEVELPEPIPLPAAPRMKTIYIGKGKKDKISRGDIVGFLCKKGGLDSSLIGKIDVKERYAYVAVSASAVKALLSKVKNEKIKGLKTVCEIIK